MSGFSRHYSLPPRYACHIGNAQRPISGGVRISHRHPYGVTPSGPGSTNYWDGVPRFWEIQVPDGATMTNGYKVTLYDGRTGAVTFEFRSSGSPSAGNIAVNFTGGMTNTQVRDAFISAVNGAPLINLLAYITTNPDLMGVQQEFHSGLGNRPATQDAALLTITDEAINYGTPPVTVVPCKSGGHPRFLPIFPSRIAASS
jgi:hypothetical protein